MNVHVFVDVLCPWCYIGHRRVAAAVAALPAPERVSIVWRSFELSPGQSRVPGPTAAEAMAEWWGARAGARVAQIRAAGAADGLDLDLHRARPVSTFDAHRLLHLAADRGAADRTLDLLFRAYHTEGRNVAAPDVLQDVGTAAGLGAGEVRGLLDGGAYADAVRADEKEAAALGVTGVPSLVVGGRPPVSAVQPPEALARLLETALAAEGPGDGG